MKGILALLFLCATSQFAHGYHFSAFRSPHGLLGPKLLGVTASVLSVIGSAYSDAEEDDMFDSLEWEEDEVFKQGRAIFNAGTFVKRRLCRSLCKNVFTHDVNTTEFSTPNSLDFKFFKTGRKQDSVKFKVKAANDAYVALVAGVDPTDLRYEVRLGILANNQVFITKDKFGVAVATAITPKILSKDELREFWIKWDEGTIRIGRGDEKRAFLAYADPKLFDVSHLGFGTRWGATGTWDVEGIGNEVSKS